MPIFVGVQIAGNSSYMHTQTISRYAHKICVLVLSLCMCVREGGTSKHVDKLAVLELEEGALGFRRRGW